MSPKQIVKAGGEPLLKEYTTIENVLRKFHPYFPWESSRFSSPKRIGWGSLLNQRLFLEKVAKELTLKQVNSISFI